MIQKRAKWMLLVLLGFGIISLSGVDRFLPSQAAISEGIGYKVTITEKPHSAIHAVTIPHDSPYLVSPAVSGELLPIEDFAASENTVAAINGGYFDPVNHKTTSFVVQKSRIVADPRFNERLIDNQDLQQYLGKILNRAEFRVYVCDDRIQYDIQPHSAPIPANCTLKSSLGGGPSLLPQNTSVAEAFTAYQDGKQIRNAIGSDSLNARSAVAITNAGDIILAMVAQQSDRPLNSGTTLSELTNFLSSQGAAKAMNLDGGSSASLYYDGRAIYGRVNAEGNKIQRPIKSALLVNRDRSF